METRFTLSKSRWYALEMIGDEFSSADGLRHCSPIRVDEVTPSRSGHRRFKLSFYHAHYPEGVRDKTYALQTMERGKRFILARSVDQPPFDFCSFSTFRGCGLRDALAFNNMEMTMTLKAGYQEICNAITCRIPE